MTTTMNTSVNQTFNWSRFVATLRKEVVENKRTLLFSVICIYGFLTLMMILGNLITSAAGVTIDSLTNKVPQMVTCIILSLVIIISASLSFRNLTTKAGRTSLFTSPSSSLEKYLVNVLIYVVGILVAYIVCAQLADLTRMAILWYFKSDTFAVPGPINYLNIYNDYCTCLAVLDDTPVKIMQDMGWIMFFGTLASAGTYMLGSIVWPRLSFLKTFAAIYALEFVLFVIGIIAFALIGDVETFSRWFFENMIGGGQLNTSMIIWVTIQIVVCYGLAWYLFKHKDVISLKWWK